MDANVFGSLLMISLVILTILLMILFFGSLVWVYRDAEGRGKTGALWVLIVFFTWPFGLIAYFILRDQEVVL